MLQYKHQDQDPVKRPPNCSSSVDGTNYVANIIIGFDKFVTGIPKKKTNQFRASL